MICKLCNKPTDNVRMVKLQFNVCNKDFDYTTKKLNQHCTKWFNNQKKTKRTYKESEEIKKFHEYYENKILRKGNIVDG